MLKCERKETVAATTDIAAQPTTSHIGARLLHMKHIELHILENEHDVELANIAGLVDDDLELFDTICVMCDELIQLEKNDEFGAIVLTDTVSKLSCETCLTDIVRTAMLES